MVKIPSYWSVLITNVSAVSTGQCFDEVLASLNKSISNSITVALSSGITIVNVNKLA